jgi:hypothetical protein
MGTASPFDYSSAASRAIVRPKDGAWEIAPSQHPPDDRLVEAEIVAMEYDTNPSISIVTRAVVKNVVI